MEVKVTNDDQLVLKFTPLEFETQISPMVSLCVLLIKIYSVGV